MNERVLFVDDDATLVAMLRRNFALDFDVSTAENGPQALEAIEKSEPFACIMVDMQMPGMNGIELIERARRIAPDSIFIMLTGNQDLTTAIQAVNDGHVFRFLNKPCEIADISKAIKAAIAQYDLVLSQRELLDRTFSGAVGVLTEIIESMDTTLVSSSRVQELAARLAEAHDIHASWSMSLACRLMFTGVPLLSNAQRKVLLDADVNDTDHLTAVEQLIETSVGLIAKIPRLGPVADVLWSALGSDGVVSQSRSKSTQFANLMMLSFYAELLLERGEEKRKILAQIDRRFPELGTIATDILSMHLKPDDDRLQEVLDEAAKDLHVRRYTPRDLEEGMVVAEHVRLDNGAMLVSAGRELTTVIIQRLRALAAEYPLGVKVLETPACENICS